jgi:hypothetical protein
MSNTTKGKMIYARAKADPILAAVMADIHRTAQKPPAGYLTREQWAGKWRLKSTSQANEYLTRAVKIGILVEKRFRVVSKGRMTTMAHYGPPPKR